MDKRKHITYLERMANPMKNASRKMSYLLRHDPQDLKMDKQGWVSVEDLLKKLNISMEQLEEIVETNDKKRFGFDEVKGKIRAHQGHSNDLKLDIKFKEVENYRTFYHGTSDINLKSIVNNGLTPRSRAYVHLSKDIETAKKVALRHGGMYVILEIDGRHMRADRKKIYESENGVLLTEYVSPKYIKIHV